MKRSLTFAATVLGAFHSGGVADGVRGRYRFSATPYLGFTLLRQARGARGGGRQSAVSSSGASPAREMLLAAFAASALACGGAEEACKAPQRPLDLYFEVTEPFPELPAFAQPVGLYQSGALPERMFVLEKGGRVLSFDVRDTRAGTALAADLSALVRTRKECGLLGMTFHPMFAQNGQVLLSYCARDG